MNRPPPNATNKMRFIQNLPVNLRSIHFSEDVFPSELHNSGSLPDVMVPKLRTAMFRFGLPSSRLFVTLKASTQRVIQSNRRSPVDGNNSLDQRISAIGTRC